MSSQISLLQKADDQFLVYGPASVEVVDDQGDKIDAAALKEALPQLLKRHSISYRIHKDILVGEILEKAEIDGKEYRTEVIDDTLYVLANIYGDNDTSRKARKEIESGVLKSYSISGRALENHVECNDASCYNRITKMDLFAVCICDRGANPDAFFTILSKAQYVEKVVEERNGQYCVMHCHGPDAGKPIKCFDTKEEADRMHRAIQAHQAKALDKALILRPGDYEEIAKQVNGQGQGQGLGGGSAQGPGGECVCPECGHREPHKTGDPCMDLDCPKCGAKMDRPIDKIEKQHPEHWGEAWKGPKPSGRGKPPKDWWDKCMARAESAGKITDPPAFCNALWHYGPESFKQAYGKGSIGGDRKAPDSRPAEAGKKIAVDKLVGADPGAAGKGPATAAETELYVRREKERGSFFDFESFISSFMASKGFTGKTGEKENCSLCFMVDELVDRVGLSRSDAIDVVKTEYERFSQNAADYLAKHSDVESGDKGGSTMVDPQNENKDKDDNPNQGSEDGDSQDLQKAANDRLDKLEKALAELTAKIAKLAKQDEEPPPKKEEEDDEDDEDDESEEKNKKKSKDAQKTGDPAPLSPEDVKKALSDMDEAARKEFFEKAGLTGLVTGSTPRPGGVATEPKTGAVAVSAEDLESRVEKSLDIGDIEGAFAQVDQYEAAQRRSRALEGGA